MCKRDYAKTYRMTKVFNRVGMREKRISEPFRKIRSSIGSETLKNLKKKEDRKVKIDKKKFCGIFFLQMEEVSKR